MRKEIIFAIVAGALFGLIIAIGAWRAKTYLNPKENNEVEIVADDINTNTDTVLHDLLVATPTNESVITQSDYIISGTTSPNSVVVVSAQDNDYYVIASDDGSFEVEADAAPGVNEIIVMSVEPDGNTITKNIVTVYSSQLASTKPDNEDEVKEEATDSAGEIRERVKDRIDDALNNPIAYLGSVTDISEDTIQIAKVSLTDDETTNGEIMQLSIDEDDTKYVSINDDETKNIDFSDVAIGDFIIAMGLVDENNVLEAKRILVTDTIEPTTRYITVGEIKSVDEKSDEISLTESDSNKTVTIIPGKAVIYSTSVEGEIENISFSDIEKGNNIAVVVIPGKSDDIFRSLYLFPVTNAAVSPEDITE